MTQRNAETQENHSVVLRVMDSQLILKKFRVKSNKLTFQIPVFPPAKI
jgi:hypothetical protein